MVEAFVDQAKRDDVTAEAVRQLAMRFEITAHTVTGKYDRRTPGPRPPQGIALPFESMRPFEFDDLEALFGKPRAMPIGFRRSLAHAESRGNEPRTEDHSTVGGEAHIRQARTRRNQFDVGELLDE